MIHHNLHFKVTLRLSSLSLHETELMWTGLENQQKLIVQQQRCGEEVSRREVAVQ